MRTPRRLDIASDHRNRWRQTIRWRNVPRSHRSGATSTSANSAGCTDSRTAGKLRRALGMPEGVPALGMLGLIAVTLVWNQSVGITWFPSLPVMLSVPAAILAVSMVYATIRPDPRVAEIMFYLALWQVFP